LLFCFTECEKHYLQGGLSKLDCMCREEQNGKSRNWKDCFKNEKGRENQQEYQRGLGNKRKGLRGKRKCINDIFTNKVFIAHPKNRSIFMIKI
jgi:hypothetical protein